MVIKQQVRWPTASLRLSLIREQRNHFRKLNLEVRQSTRAYIRVSGGRMAPFLIRDADPYGVLMPDGDSYSFKFPDIHRNRFIDRDEQGFRNHPQLRTGR